MNHSAKTSPIKVFFRKQVRKDPKVKNAYLLVHSDKTGLHINLSEGVGDNGKPTPQQPNYMASVRSAP
jgi:D-alanyl-D-alanine carboxypeptidase